MNAPRPLRLAVLLSGTGRTFQNFLAEHAAGRLPVEFAVVISSTSKARGLQFAQEAGIPTSVLPRRRFDDSDEYGRALAERLREAGTELVAMAGFLHLWTLPEDFQGRVLNIHPSLLPAFGGAGFFGSRVHQAVFEAGVRVTGCTVHFADNEYDTGPIVLQRGVELGPGDDPDAIAAKVFEQECIAYPEAIRLFGAGRLRTEGRRVEIMPPDAEGTSPRSS